MINALEGTCSIKGLYSKGKPKRHICEYATLNLRCIEIKTNKKVETHHD
jgi:hypothetical protein